MRETEKLTDFHIDVKPVSITFACPDCEKEVKLGEYEYD